MMHQPHRGVGRLLCSRSIRRFTLLLGLVGCDRVGTTSSEPVLFPILENQKLGFIDATGKVKIPPTTDVEMTWETEEAHVLLSLSLNEGVADRLNSAGREDEELLLSWLFPEYLGAAGGDVLRYDLALKGLAFREGRLPFRQAGRWGYLAEDGSLPITPQFDAVGPFAEGKAAVRLKDLWGFIDRAGTTVIPASYVAVASFSEGRAAVWPSETQCGYIDDAGAFLINPKYQLCFPFRDGVGVVVAEGGRWGVVDEDGVEVIVPQYRGLSPFVGSHAAARFADAQYGIVDHLGKVVVRPTYEFIFPPNASGDPWLMRQGGRFGFIDLSGRVVVGPVYDMALPFSNGIAAVRQGAKWGFITIEGKFLANVSPQYDEVRSLKNGRAAVRMGTRWGFIDETGKIAISPKYDAVGNFEGALAPMAVSGRRGYVDRTGAVIREPMDSLPFATLTRSILDEVPAPAAAPDYYTPAPAATDSAAWPAATEYAAPAAEWSPSYGTTHEVRMYGDERGYRFEPRNLTVRTGDAVRFVFLSGGPHNVAFDGTYLSEMVRRQLDANFSSKMATLSSNMMLNPGEAITVSFANIPAGRYPYNCTPHLAMGMSGVITVLP